MIQLMTNPFEVILDRLNSIENLILSEAQKNKQPRIKKVNRREAARIQGISTSMLDKVRDNYIHEKIGAKRLFLVKDGQLVKSSLSD